MTNQFHRHGALPRAPTVLAAAALLLQLGCASNQPEPKNSAAPIPTDVAVSPPTTADLSDVRVSEGVQQRCNLPDTPREAPQFDFDEADLRDRGKRILDDVARCMLEGGLKGEGIVLVGHADPRGADTYNDELGMRRAEAARDYVMTRGITLSRVTVDSRGERDARGYDESTWQIDRNVEVREATPAEVSGSAPGRDGTCGSDRAC